MESWRNRSPRDLEDQLPVVEPDDVRAAVRRSVAAFRAWSVIPLDERIIRMRECRDAIASESESLAQLIVRETGKPITEARGELGAVVAKFELTIEDALTFIADRPVASGPHPAMVRSRPRGPAAVVAPFNFPIHLGHGAAVAYLLAGNTVLYKPSPLAAATGAAYGKLMAAHLPEDAFQVVQGGGEAGRTLCLEPAVRSVCFTGSIPVGTALARDLAADYSKSLALELGGKCASIVCHDADIAAASARIAEATCLTAGQRCNATSLAYVSNSVLDDFIGHLIADFAAFAPGDPAEESTRMGPLISEAAVDRYRSLLALEVGENIVRGETPDTIGGRRGHWVTPAVVCSHDYERLTGSPLFQNESFCPILTVIPFADDDAAMRMQKMSPFGLTTSIFTETRSRFDEIAASLAVGNVYWNLPTTLSPSTLPFSGFGISGNGKPGGRGFIRFAADEQALQWKDVES